MYFQSTILFLFDTHTLQKFYMRSKTKPFLQIQMTALVLREGKGRESGTAGAISLKPLCLSEERTKGNVPFLPQPFGTEGRQA